MQIKKTNKSEVIASKKSSANDKALSHIKAAIDILATRNDEVSKDSIANLGVVMFDLMGSEE